MKRSPSVTHPCISGNVPEEEKIAIIGAGFCGLGVAAAFKVCPPSHSQQVFIFLFLLSLFRDEGSLSS